MQANPGKNDDSNKGNTVFCIFLSPPEMNEEIGTKHFEHTCGSGRLQSSPKKLHQTQKLKKYMPFFCYFQDTPGITKYHQHPMCTASFLTMSIVRSMNLSVL